MPKAMVLQQKIREAVTYARQICAEQGTGSTACTTAWKTVEELQAETAHQQADQTFGSRAFGRSGFEQDS